MKKLFKKESRFKLVLLIYFICAILVGGGASAILHAVSSYATTPKITKDSIEAIAVRAEENCSESDKNQCYPQYFYELTKKNDIKLSIPVLSHLQKIDPQNSRGCHFIAHRMSQAEVEKNPQKWEKVLTEMSPSLCSGGFLHGVLEVHAGNDPDFEINNETVVNICGKMVGIKSKFGERSCFHSMGHLLLIQKSGEIEEAVSQCNTIAWVNARYECLSGAFMETITQENLLAHGYIKEKDNWDRNKAVATESLCGRYSGLPAKACWKEISFIYFAIHNSDPVGLYNECQAAPTQEMRNECFIYGAGNVVNTIRFNDDNLVNVCHQMLVDDPLFNSCMYQIIGSMLTTTTDNIDRALGLCGNAYENYKQKCYSLILGVLTRNNEDEKFIKNTCSSFPNYIKNNLCG